MKNSLETRLGIFVAGLGPMPQGCGSGLGQFPAGARRGSRGQTSNNTDVTP